MSITEKAISFMEAIAADDTHGYSQYSRWQSQGTDFDCSSLVITAWREAGVQLSCTYTGNMYNNMLNNNFMDMTGSVNLYNGSGLKRGDVLLNHHSHVAMYCGNGLEVEASQDSHGGIGDEPGDQNGQEILIRGYRNYPWDCVLRYNEPAVEDNHYHFRTVKISIGSYGTNEYRLQMILKARGYYKGKLDWWYGEQTAKALKEFLADEVGLSGDGRTCGAEVWARMLSLAVDNEGKWILREVSKGDKDMTSVLLWREYFKAQGYTLGLSCDYDSKLDEIAKDWCRKKGFDYNGKLTKGMAKKAIF